MSTARKALVLGATGGAGGEIAAALLRRGWQVRGLVRDASRPGLSAPIEWHAGDAMNAADVAQAAHGVKVIVHAVNPPGYRNWQKLSLPMLEHTLAAARATGARIMLPGNVYNYGPDALPLLHEDSPQHPLTRKGAIRVAMEQRLQQAAAEGVRTLILRCGDFFGPRASSNWFAAMVKPGRPVRAVNYPGEPGLRHAWAYLPDVGETAAALLEREHELAAFECFHFGGHWVDGQAMAAAIRRATGHAKLPLRPFPWWLVTLAAPLVALFRELREMRYLWQLPLQLDNRKLVALLGTEPHTELDQAVEATLRGLGCLNGATAKPTGSKL
ncbi:MULTISPECIES: NAD-dependent epimerase/dehydratase family protein [Rhodanobacter]|uniref:NAD-dependent epimerase/dehydratase family protein n=1 Tax=Rhodanobacter TaxID=75309 RepID=UPI000568A684|nr:MULTISPECIES: NAD-dependent epimerase/dehydratase family protein [Rhodanobacter]TAN15710.1 MAG: NAD-dependent epimerase/dehydratase family protein [Rhodanobacter sp.]UJJ56512.1 NAD-dependent epimerase/dehydratase family protein [Rhodanobacter thiooxydans]